MFPKEFYLYGEIQLCVNQATRARSASHYDENVFTYGGIYSTMVAFIHL